MQPERKTNRKAQKHKNQKPKPKPKTKISDTDIKRDKCANKQRARKGKKGQDKGHD